MSKKVNKKHIGVEKYNKILQMLIANARKNDLKYVLKDFQQKASELYGGYRNKSIKTITAKSVEQAKPVELKPTQRKYKGVTKIKAIDVPNRWFDGIWSWYEIGQLVVDFSQAYPTIPVLVRSNNNEISFVGTIENYVGSIMQEFTEKLRIEFENKSDATFVGIPAQANKKIKQQFAFWGESDLDDKDFPNVIEPIQISAETQELVNKREELIDTKRKLQKLEKKLKKKAEKKPLPKIDSVKPKTTKPKKEVKKATALKDKNKAIDLLIEQKKINLKELELGIMTKQDYINKGKLIDKKIKKIETMFEQGGLI